MLRIDGVGAGLWVLMAGACADRTLGGETGGSSEAGTTTTGDTPTSTDPSSPGTTVPGTTVPGTTATTEPGTTATTVPGTTATTEPGTTVTSEPGTTTVDPSGPDTATEGPIKLDLPALPAAVPAGIASGCTKEPPGLSAVKGDSLLGPIVSQRAYFGYVAFNNSLDRVRLLFIDDAADVDVAMLELEASFGEVSTGPALQVSPSQVFTDNNPFWLGVDETAVLSVRVGGDATEVLATVEINGHAGDWGQVVPDDPARLLGTIAPGGGQFQFAGEFDAVYCHLLTQEIFAE